MSTTAAAIDQAKVDEFMGTGGFSRFRRATETPFNLVLQARP